MRGNKQREKTESFKPKARKQHVKNRGWVKESERHSLASKGVSTKNIRNITYDQYLDLHQPLAEYMEDNEIEEYSARKLSDLEWLEEFSEFGNKPIYVYQWEYRFFLKSTPFTPKDLTVINKEMTKIYKKVGHTFEEI